VGFRPLIPPASRSRRAKLVLNLRIRPCEGKGNKTGQMRYGSGTIRNMVIKDWTVDSNRLQQALAKLVVRVKPRRVVAFGSRARHEAKEDSDLDIAILYDAPPAIETAGDAWRTFSEFELPVDLLNVSLEKHLTFKDSRNSVHYRISKEGVVLYDAETGFARPHAVEALAR
jgi:predicted nucleotidyltransferase